MDIDREDGDGGGGRHQKPPGHDAIAAPVYSLEAVSYGETGPKLRS